MLLTGVHVKMLLQWPAVVRPGQVVSERASALDLLPTLVQAASGSQEPVVPSLDARHASLDGLSLLPLLQRIATSPGLSSPPQQQVFQERVLYWRFNATCRAPKRSLLQGSYKWLRAAHEGAGNSRQ